MSKRSKLKAMFGRNPSSGNHTPGATSAPGGSHSAPSPLTTSVPQITRQAREWWKENKATILASLQTVLSIVEKGLDGLPVYGPKAAVAAVVEAMRAVRVRVLSRVASSSMTLMHPTDDGREQGDRGGDRDARRNHHQAPRPVQSSCYILSSLGFPRCCCSHRQVYFVSILSTRYGPT
jgi:hypothetical protein